MLTNMNVRTFRPQVSPLGTRQRVSRRRGQAWSPELLQRVGIYALATVVVVMAAGQLLQWRIASAADQVRALEQVRAGLGSTHVNLLATRAKLASRQRVEAVAAVKFGLYAPKKNQVHRL
ncbi:hypothetical protein ACLG6S_10670 [Thermodesulfobacteriota bacterium B35]